MFPDRYYIRLIALTILVMTAFSTTVYGAGEFLSVERTVKNLSTHEGYILELLPLYTPRSYKMDLDANGGSFADGSSLREIDVVYNDGREIFDETDTEGDYKKENENFIAISEEPIREGFSFLGWYLRGNRLPESPGPLDGELIKDGSRYMIVNDDEEEMDRTLHYTADKTVALAIWRENHHVMEDGNEADDELWEETEGSLDLWDSEHANNHVIEYIEGAETKTDYEAVYGDIKDQYRRIALDAETEFAKGYTWYVKPAGSSDSLKLDSTEGVYVADRLDRSNDGDIYRCEVLIGANGESLIYETEISVHWLPRLGEPQITAERSRIKDEA